MDKVSRPLLGLLLATVAVAALWVTMLKPSNSTSGGSSGSAANPSLGQLSGAVAAAHKAVSTSNAASAAHGGAVAAGAAKPAASQPVTHSATTAAKPVTQVTPAKPATTTKTATHTRARARVVHHAAPPLTAAGRLHLVAAALAKRQVLAMLFYNPAAADDRLVRKELATISTHHEAVVKLAIPLGELANYSVVTQQVPVTGSPTLVIIDRGRGATELVGFTDRFEIAQRIDDALAVK